MSDLNERAGKALAGHGIIYKSVIPNERERQQGYATPGPFRDPDTGMLWIVARPAHVWEVDMSDPATRGAFEDVIRSAWNEHFGGDYAHVFVAWIEDYKRRCRRARASRGRSAGACMSGEGMGCGGFGRHVASCGRGTP